MLTNASLFLYITVTLTFSGLSECRNNAALIIIDMQDCFISGGSLAVTGSDDIIPIINTIRDKYQDKWSMVVLSQDWHPTGHVSFASSHPGGQSSMTLQYSPKGQLCTSESINVSKFPDAISCQGIPDTKTLSQVLWPDHCVQNVTSGPSSASFAPRLKVEGDDVIIQKGTDREIDSYSAFFDNGGFGKTRLDDELRARGITHVFVTGVAADFCVYFTSLDAQELGYETYYVMDATKPVSDGTYKTATQNLAKKGVHLITTDMMPEIFKEMTQDHSGGHRPLGLSILLPLTIALMIEIVL